MPPKSANKKPPLQSLPPNLLTGKLGEDIAVKFLQRKKIQILDRNFRIPEGELDIIAQDGEVIVFVEVKYRATDAFGHPSIAVTDKKIEKLMKAAEQYLEQKNLENDFRFDIISVLPHSIEHFENVTM